MTLEEYVQSIKDKRICFIGAGISNRPLIRLLLMSGCDVSVRDIRTAEKLDFEDLSLIGLGAKYKLGEDYLLNLDADIIFRSPSFLPFNPSLEEAKSRGAEITSEMEVFFRVCPCRTIAVTGSDGKTTTSSIIAELLKEAGYTVHLGGNIGKPLLCETPLFDKDDIAVLELSSFQLHSMYCKPDVAVVTNISPNHLDKHRNLEDYVSAKENIFKYQDSSCTLVLNCSDSVCRSFAEKAEARIRWFSDGEKNGNGYFCIDNKIICIKDGQSRELFGTEAVRLPGRHNIQNYLAAFAAVDSFCPEACFKKVAGEFAGVEHRLEFVRELHGVTYINDSIGTSPSRTIAALHSFSLKPIVILGGYDKHIPFDNLGDEVCRFAKAAVLTGASAEKIKDAICRSQFYSPDELPLVSAENLVDAVYEAGKLAKAGDRVILSPACASFDCFKNFEERGNFFKKTVMEMPE